MRYRRALTIAGSDPSGGAGLQADLKTFTTLGVYGTTAIVAIVDENTQGVYGVHPVPVPFVVGQIRSVLSDIGTDAVKIGMLHSSELIRAVKSTLMEYPDVRDIVLDPVMVATSGDPLLLPDAVETLKTELIPYSRLITPNIPEASLLLGQAIDRQGQLPDAALALGRLYNVSVLLKAGHLTANRDSASPTTTTADGDSDSASPLLVDVFYNNETGEIIKLESPRIDTKNTHGTGCTLSSAIAAHLAKGQPLTQAVKSGKKYLSDALKSGAQYRIGHGHGPVNHLHLQQ